MSCSFIQFNVHTSRVGPFHLFFCDIMAATSFFFFHLHLSDSFLNRYTYRHLCIYAPRDLNIHCSELSIDIFFNLFLFFSYSPHLALSWSAVYPTEPTSICFSIFTFAFLILLPLKIRFMGPQFMTSRLPITSLRLQGGYQSAGGSIPPTE